MECRPDAFNAPPHHLLSIRDLAAEQIQTVLSLSAQFKVTLEGGGRTNLIEEFQQRLKGQSVVLLFFEPSTRTRTSFEMAARKLGMGVTSLSIAVTSVAKGESLKDTVLTLMALGFNAFIIRHPHSGAPHFVARVLEEEARKRQTTLPKVLNAGDGMHEHPTQALLDLLTLQEVFGRIQGLKVAFVGDILHSRVARSGMWALSKLGAQVRLCGPPTMVPRLFERVGVSVFERMEEAVRGADVVYLLRLQLERQQVGLFPSIAEYHRLYGLSLNRLKDLCPDALVMHPGPMNRGVEISGDLADSDKARILDQVTNGVAVRMAVLSLLLTDSVEWWEG
ncbi:MAG: aspartate carbamoyltransferase catalytic subunit [Armatimonadetes bacterium]|nr:aspartate carbamoyltransferase catalytic subunit [Armatimonadota bacterium]